ncbi:Rossmann-like and DUF2520 domain-containing protein [Novosphingobium barchaimii]|nr:Rossmann-like and DUF2520 domain-containing protein [Novosphingobium barchaimii]
MTAPSLIRQIGIIGTGKVARAMALALGKHSAKPPMLWGRTRTAMEEAIAQIGHGVAANSLAALVQACDVTVIAVSDDAITAVAETLAQAGRLDHAPLVFHVSGSSGTAILSALHSNGALTAAIHPAMTFTGDPHLEVVRMAGAHFAVTGSDSKAAARAHGLIRMLGGVSVEVAETQRTLYHAALCHAANHLVTLIAGASGALRAAGAENPRDFLAPLVRAALDNALERGIGALSGPVLRGDTGTVCAHLTAIEAGYPDMLAPYRAMALATAEELARQEPSALVRQHMLHSWKIIQ